MVIINLFSDAELPVITVCPPDIEVNTDAAVATALVLYQPPTATGNSGEVTVTCDPPSESDFPIGQTTVACVAVDSSGNDVTCNFQVNVKGIKGIVSLWIE